MQASDRDRDTRLVYERKEVRSPDIARAGRIAVHDVTRQVQGCARFERVVRRMAAGGNDRQGDGHSPHPEAAYVHVASAFGVPAAS